MIEFYKIKIELSVQDSGIKGMLQSMIKQDFSIEDLKLQMEKKIQEEKAILKRLEQFDIESANLPGKEVYRYDYESMSKGEIKQMIERQKREIDEFIVKFKDLDSYIKHYKEEQFEIKKVRAAIASYEN